MRLRTHESFWLLKNGLLYSYPSLQKDISCDFLVVGGGITGALVSHALMDEGYQVILIDKRDIGQGSTSATTSMLQYEIDEPLVSLSVKIGEEGAATCYKEGIVAIDKLAMLIKDLKIDCDFSKKKSLYIAHAESAIDMLKKEFEIRNRHNLGVTWLDEATLLEKFGINSKGAIYSDCAASIDAYKLTHELIAHNVKRGMQVFDQTEVSLLDSKSNKPLLSTDSGCKITCEKVIYCNGFEATEMIKENIANLFYTYAAVSEQNKREAEKIDDVLIWNTDSPYTYMRTTTDGRILIGGEDSAFNVPLLEEKIKKIKGKILIDKMQQIIPGVNFIEDFTWAGKFGSTKDGLPYIGASPEYTNAYFVLGFGGNGIVFSIQAMDLITNMIKGKHSLLEEYYKFGR